MLNSSQIANKIASKKVRDKRLAREGGSCHAELMKLRIRQLRDNKGLNGETLAARVGCSKSYLSEIETGKKWPSGRLLQAFSRELGVTIYDLIETEDLGVELATHLAVLRDLSDADRRAVLRHAAGLLDRDVEQA